ncbi:uncharacterized protein AB675_4919 [Cyphellophora attinorum]|uniref:Nucleoporin n=1 Tax=Cyphellophora attinorum TaxID=1664694 RepID=A0A0N1H2K6_9EURO|nr:uncharacterized protein AB675_4919 [Phialophora attinorum]KPI34605.1 hypothetical protein AB675_4919 [Phialophora attinorum]
MLTLYGEVEVPDSTASSLASTTSTSVVYRIPSRDGSQAVASVLKQGPQARTIEEFSRSHLASAGGAHFKSEKGHGSTSYLWRVTADDRILQLEPASLTNTEQPAGRSTRPLFFEFPDPIRDHTVGFADLTDEDGLEVFICTNKNELHHLTIPAAAFSAQEQPSEAERRNRISQWHRQINITSLQINTVFRLQVHSATEIFLCFTSGSIQHLTRKSGSHKWDGLVYDDATWGSSFSSLLGRGGSRKLEYGSTYVDSRTAQAIQASADSTYLYTVCLNHQLRVWHVPSGKLVVAKDLLDHEGDEHARTLSAFDRGHLQHLQGVEMRGSILVTFSPRDGGQFKFWDVRGGLTDTLTVSDRYPGVKLTPPDPDPTGTTVWSMVSFRVVPYGELDARGSAQLWILWRNNDHYTVYSLHFDLDDIGRSWPEHNWLWCGRCHNTVLKYLTAPGRYPDAVLETALNIFSRSTSTRSNQTSDSDLCRRICDAIAPAARLKKQEGGSMNFDAFSYEVDQSWRTFHRTVEKVNDTRFGPLSLAHDGQVARPVLIMADKVVLLQELDRFGLALHNSTDELSDLESIASSRWPHRQVSTEESGVSLGLLAQLLQSARRFAHDFPPDLTEGLEATITDLLFLNGDQVIPSVLSDMYDDLAFGELVSDDAFHRLENSFRPLGGIEALSNDLILAALGLLPQISGQDGSLTTSIKEHLGGYLQDQDLLNSLLSIREVLSSLIAVIVFVEGEFNQDEGAKMPNFDAAELFNRVAPMLRTTERDAWVLRHFNGVSDGSSPQDRSTGARESLKQFLYRNDRQMGENDISAPLEATAVDVLEHVANADFITSTIGLFCASCDGFLPAKPFAAYMRGRLALLRHEVDRAEQYFHQAAFGLAHGRATHSLVDLSLGFIDEVESDDFYNGLPRYLRHVMTLFEQASAHAQVVHFGKATLQALTTDQRETSPELKFDVLKSLLKSNISLLRFRAAFDTVTQLNDPRSAAQSATHLIQSILDTQTNGLSTKETVNILLSFPWALHPDLAERLDVQLTTLAKQQKTISTTNASALRPSTILQGPANDTDTPDHLSIVHALRLAQGDYRGAIAALHDRLRLVLQQSRARADPQATAIRHALLALINALSCVSVEEAWIVTDSMTEAADEAAEKKAGGGRWGMPDVDSLIAFLKERNAGGGSGGGIGEKRDSDDAAADADEDDASNSRPAKKRRRVIITLADLRRQYQDVLDRCARVERGDFGFDEEDGEDEIEDEDMELEGNANGGGIRQRLIGGFRGDDASVPMQIDGLLGRSERMELTILPNGGAGAGGDTMLGEGRSLLAVR